jgi:hypothetical protein
LSTAFSHFGFSVAVLASNAAELAAQNGHEFRQKTDAILVMELELF